MEMIVMSVMAALVACFAIYLWFDDAAARRDHEAYQNLYELIREVEDIREQLDQMTAAKPDNGS